MTVAELIKIIKGHPSAEVFIGDWIPNCDPVRLAMILHCEDGEKAIVLSAQRNPRRKRQCEPAAAPQDGGTKDE